MPSVVMNDGTPMPTVMIPLMNPTTEPERSPMITASQIGVPQPVALEVEDLVENAYTWPTERSISPQIRSITIPAAMITIGAEYSAMTWALSLPEERLGTDGEVDDSPSASRMSASRRRTSAAATRRPSRRVAVFSGCRRLLSPPPGQPGCATGILQLAGTALVAGLRRQVRLHVRLRHERDAGVRVRGRHQAGRVPVEEELQDGQPALQVRLLIDREVENALA